MTETREEMWARWDNRAAIESDPDSVFNQIMVELADRIRQTTDAALAGPLQPPEHLRDSAPAAGHCTAAEFAALEQRVRETWARWNSLNHPVMAVIDPEYPDELERVWSKEAEQAWSEFCIARSEWAREAIPRKYRRGLRRYGRPSARTLRAAPESEAFAPDEHVRRIIDKI